MSEPTDETEAKDPPNAAADTPSSKSEKEEAPLADAIDKAFADDVDPLKKKADEEDSNGAVPHGEEAELPTKGDADDGDDGDRKKKKTDLFLPKGNPYRTKRGLIA